jgi:hypothetical protein
MPEPLKSEGIFPVSLMKFTLAIAKGNMSYGETILTVVIGTICPTTWAVITMMNEPSEELKAAGPENELMKPKENRLKEFKKS